MYQCIEKLLSDYQPYKRGGWMAWKSKFYNFATNF